LRHDSGLVNRAPASIRDTGTYAEAIDDKRAPAILVQTVANPESMANARAAVRLSL